MLTEVRITGIYTDEGLKIEMYIKFEDTDVWKKTHRLILDIYKVTNFFPKEETYNLLHGISKFHSASQSAGRAELAINNKGHVCKDVEIYIILLKQDIPKLKIR